MGDTEIGYGDIEEDWHPSAHNACNIGIAIAKQHPDFYYSMAEFDIPRPTQGGGERSPTVYVRIQTG